MTIGVFTSLLLDLVMLQDEYDRLGLDSGRQWFRDFWEFGIDYKTTINHSILFYLESLFHSFSHLPIIKLFSLDNIAESET